MSAFDYYCCGGILASTGIRWAVEAAEYDNIYLQVLYAVAAVGAVVLAVKLVRQP